MHCETLQRTQVSNNNNRQAYKNTNTNHHKTMRRINEKTQTLANFR